MKAKFKVSTETRREQLEKGIELPETIEIEINFSELTDADRKTILRHSNLEGDTIYPGYDGSREKPHVSSWFPFEIRDTTKSLWDTGKNDLATLDAWDQPSLIRALNKASDLIDHELATEQKRLLDEARRKKIEELTNPEKNLAGIRDWKHYEIMQEEYLIPDEIMAEVKDRWQAQIDEIKEKEAREEAERKEKERAKAEKKQAMEAERTEWIEKNGSDRLKKMVKGGYEYRMTYEQERAGLEYPDFEIDAEGERFGWTDRANPSEEALQAAEAAKGEVVWLTRDRAEEPDPEYGHSYYEFEEREAVKISPDWCRYQLIRSL